MAVAPLSKIPHLASFDDGASEIRGEGFEWSTFKGDTLGIAYGDVLKEKGYEVMRHPTPFPTPYPALREPRGDRTMLMLIRRARGQP